MEYIIAIIICLVFLLVLKFAWGIRLKDIKRLKDIGYNKELNEITNKLPKNKDICKDMLHKLDNETVIIKESENNKASFYFVLSNSILIANIKDTFTRVQTIAHECLHSVQNRRTLLFNFIYSNLYLIYFVAICILTLLGLNQHGMLHLFILTVLSSVYYAIRSYLEMDAMTKAKPLAKEYLEEQETINKEEINKILDNYEIINQIGIKLTNYKLITNCSIKIIILCLFTVWFNLAS